MTDTVITSLEQVTTEWLTDVLKQSGALHTGAVASFAFDTAQRLLSSNAKITLTYTPEAGGDLPCNLFLKLVDTDQDDEFFSSSEVNYYTRDYVGVEGAPLPRVYHAVYSEALGRYHILMDDLSLTHIEAKAKTPTLEYGLALAEGAAALHAHWWGAEQLAAVGEQLPSAEKINRFVSIAQPGAGHILAAVGDQLKPHWPDAIRDFYEHHPQLMIEGTRDANGFTLIHGDMTWNNIFVPKSGDRPIYILDRQPFDWSLTVWLGVYDLAYAMVMDWDTEIRRALERPVLKRYHEQLTQRGVQGYSWEQLWDDYRLSAAMGIYIATEWCRGQFYPDTMPMWMPMLQNSLTAFDDLDCSNLWS